MQKLKVKKEFKDLIFPLSDDEFRQLEQNILAEGIRDSIVTWDGYIIDGHNRYEIARLNNLAFTVIEKQFDNEDQVMDWMDANQLGRRNLTPDQRILLIGRRYNREKKKHGGDRKSQKSSDQNDHLKTAEELADQYKVSAPTVRRYGKEAEDFEKMKEEEPELAKEILGGKKSLKDIKKKKKIEKRKANIEQVKTKIETENTKLDGVFDVIVIDPPWAYNERGGFSVEQHDPDNNRGGVDYPTMTVEQISNITLPEKQSTVLFLWTTHAFLRDSFYLLDQWEYDYKATIVWDKELMGMGRNIRMQCEFCLLATKGNPILQGSSERDILREKRREHSRKPDVFYQMVERMTIGRRLDYFARSKREGWYVYGAETEKF